MPTGYTAEVQEGKITELEDFVLICARAMGACIMQRDNDLHERHALRTPAPHYRQWAQEAQEEYERALSWTISEAQDMADKDYQKHVVAWKEREAKRVEEKERYEAMVAKVTAWEPPTPEHEGLKTFMLEQLTESIRFDCNYSYPKPFPQSGQEYKDAQLAGASESMARYDAMDAEEVERCRTQNEWIVALYESLGLEVPT